MLKFALSLFLVLSLLGQFVFPPTRAKAQPISDEGAVASLPKDPTSVEPNLEAKPGVEKVDLKRVFEVETERFKAESAKFDPDKLEREKAKQTQKRGWTKRDTALMALFAAGIAVLVVLVIKYGKNCAETNTPNCNIGTDENCYCLRYEEEQQRPAAAR